MEAQGSSSQHWEHKQMLSQMAIYVGSWNKWGPGASEASAWPRLGGGIFQYSTLCVLFLSCFSLTEAVGLLPEALGRKSSIIN